MNTAWKTMTFEDGTTVQMPVIVTSSNSWYYKPPQARPSRPKETFGRGEEGREAAERWLEHWFRDLIRTRGMPVEVEGYVDDPVGRSYWTTSQTYVAHRWRTRHGSVILKLDVWNGKATWSLSVPILISKDLTLRASARTIRSGYQTSGGKVSGEIREIVRRFVSDPWAVVSHRPIDGLAPTEAEIVSAHEVGKSEGTTVSPEAALMFDEHADAIVQSCVEDWLDAFRLASTIIPVLKVHVEKAYNSDLRQTYVKALTVSIDGTTPHSFRLELDTKKAFVTCSYQEDDRIQAQKILSELTEALGDDAETESTEETTTDFRTVESETTTIRL